MSVFKSKLLTLGVVFLCFLYFTNDFNLIDIEKTAIVVSLGVDYESASGDYTVTAQIATPESSSEMTVKNEKRTISAKGKTVAEAIENVGAATGWYPMLSFCELLVVGKSVAEENLMETAAFFLRSDDIPDSALLAAAENTAAEILTASPVLDSVTAIAIEKIISDAQKSKLIAMSSVKDFAQGYYSRSGCSYMPLIKKVEAKTAEGEGEGESESGEKFLFDATSTRVFSFGVSRFDLTREETFVFNLITSGARDVTFPVEDVIKDGKPCDAFFKVKSIKTREKLLLCDTPRYEITLGLSLVIVDAKAATDVSDLHPSAKVPENALKKAEEKIATAFYSAFNKAAENDCDLFRLKDTLFKFNYDFYDEYADFLSKRAAAKITVNCTSRG